MAPNLLNTAALNTSVVLIVRHCRSVFNVLFLLRELLVLCDLFNDIPDGFTIKDIIGKMNAAHPSV